MKSAPAKPVPEKNSNASMLYFGIIQSFSSSKAE